MRIFVSSVQKELEDERLIIHNLIQTDPFLSAHCVPVLYELEPASPDRAKEGCLKLVETCQVYLVIIGKEHGTIVGDYSITHLEYRRAKELGLPILAFIKGGRELVRDEGTVALLDELEKDDLKYKRFGNVIALQIEVRNALKDLLRDRFGINASSDENLIAKQTIEATSTFESQPMVRLRWEDLNHDVARILIAEAEGKKAEDLSERYLLSGVLSRGLVWVDPRTGVYYATAAGIVLLANDPSVVFPQCRILADCYRGTEPDGNPLDHEDIRTPMPAAIDRAIGFIDRNTRHPIKVVGLYRIHINEYPIEALREALVNAVAHRQYEDAGRKIILEVFPDRVVVSSPGLPPSPITLDDLRKGNYLPCSRNPVLAHCLSYFHRIEERGSGFRRMREQMLNHGLEIPNLATNTGYFQVTFPGPGENLDRIRTPVSAHDIFISIVPPSIESQLNERQIKMVELLLQGRRLTRRKCENYFGVGRTAIITDFALLVKLGLATKQGRGPSTSLIMAELGKG
jgi:predicted HTH transcriptional regulator